MIAAIDQWLINNVYQKLVNTLNKEPHWCVEQCAFVIFMAAGLKCVMQPFTPWALFGLVIEGMIGALFLFYSRQPILLKAMGQRPQFRILFLLLSMMGIWMNIMSDANIMLRLVRIAYEIAFVSVYYFAACNSPPPPKPRTKLVPTT